MTISTTESRISYAGNGSTTDFSYPYLFLENGDLVVVLISSTGTETAQVLDTDYTLTGAGSESGGTVTMGTAPASGETLVIYREMDMTQETDYIEGDAFPAESHETALDRLTMLIQQVHDQTERSLRTSISSTIDNELPAPVANSYIKVNSDADGWEFAIPDSDLIPIQATAPDSSEYVLWYDTTNEVFKYWDGGAWESTADVSGKADKVSSPTAGNVAGLDSNGNLTDSGIAASNIVVNSDIADMLESGDIGTTVQGYDADTPTVAASTAEMEAGTETGIRSMSPADIAAAISELATGTITQLESWTPTAVNEKVFTWDESVYSRIILIARGIVPGSDGATPYLQLGYGATPTFWTTSDYNTSYEDLSANNANATQNSIRISAVPSVSAAGAGVGNATNEGINFYAVIDGSSSISLPYYFGTSMFVRTPGTIGNTYFRGCLVAGNLGTGICKAVKMGWDSTDVFSTVGKIYVYGVKA
jgi:hypothetical protein